MSKVKKPLIRGQLVVDKDAKPITADGTCRAFTGLPFDQLVEAIRKNEGGKYDCLYSDEETNQCK